MEWELGRAVHLNDDGRSPSMYDLRIGHPESPDVAIEVVGAVDPLFTETWNIGPAKGPLQMSLRGDWILEIAAHCRVKRLDAIEPILKRLEDRGVHSVRVDYSLRWSDETLFAELDDLGIGWLSCYRSLGGGKVHLTMPGIGGPVDEDGVSVPDWACEFLRNSDRADVINKLRISCATLREVFVIVSFGGAPWLVESYLTGKLDRIPFQPPDLPSPISGVWLISDCNSRGIRWDGYTWSSFRAKPESP